MLQVFYLDVAYVANDYIRMLQVYVSNVSAISNVLQVYVSNVSAISNVLQVFI
jgi:hypothetical protein